MRQPKNLVQAPVSSSQSGQVSTPLLKAQVLLGTGNNAASTEQEHIGNSKRTLGDSHPTYLHEARILQLILVICVFLTHDKQCLPTSFRTKGNSRHLFHMLPALRQPTKSAPTGARPNPTPCLGPCGACPSGRRSCPNSETQVLRGTGPSITCTDCPLEGGKTDQYLQMGAEFMAT